ncbi:MAG: M28 family peptidase [Nocardioidaceae bacterium]
MRAGSRIFARSRRLLLVVVLTLAVGPVAVAAPLPMDPTDPTAPGGLVSASQRLRAAVAPEAIVAHLRELDAIAAANGGTRASGTPGYAASRDYVVRRLRAAGYRPTVQPFDFAFYAERAPATLRQLSPVPTTYEPRDDVVTMEYSGSGSVTGEVVAVDTDATPTSSSTSGCEPADFADFPVGAVALVQRGGCLFADKVAQADTAGATAVILFNHGADGEVRPVDGTLGEPVDLPVVAVGFAVGRDLAARSGTTVELVTDTESGVRETWNVTAETRSGDQANVVLAGAHLDSVNGGAGINDNGSGSATLLEIAEHMSVVEPRNQVRFAWWGAEERGLLGSAEYVSQLQQSNPGALSDIRLYLNVDMVGSPNYVRFVYDGDNSAFPVGPDATAAPRGSAAIETLFTSYFADQGLASSPTAFDGRSDYGPFIEVGIPAGGLFSGAEGLKTARQALVYGGRAGEPYDSCYHEACDTVSNTSTTAIDELSDALAHAVATYARTTDSLGPPAASNAD